MTDTYMQKLQKELKKKKVDVDIDMLDSHPSSIVSEWISTGILPLDAILGGGIPVGRCTEIYGDESTGKSLLADHIAAEAIVAGADVIYADSEAAVSLPMIKAVGVDTSKLIYFIPETMEEVFTTFGVAIDIRDPNDKIPLVLIWDSVAASATRAEMDKEYGKHHMAPQARIMSASLRKMTASISKKNIAVVFINQTRSKIGVLFGPSKDTTGGKALKFYTSIRVELAHKGKIWHKTKDKKDPDAVIGVMLQAQTVKNKVCPPYKYCRLPVYFDFGVDDAAATLEFLKLKSIITTTGAWHECEALKLEKKFQASDWQDIYDKKYEDIVKLCGL